MARGVLYSGARAVTKMVLEGGGGGVYTYTGLPIIVVRSAITYMNNIGKAHDKLCILCLCLWNYVFESKGALNFLLKTDNRTKIDYIIK